MSYLPALYPQFIEDNGQPIEDGYIWIGEADQDAATHPIAVYADEARTITLEQPVRTTGGYPAYQGAATRLYLAAGVTECSVTVHNKRDVAVFTNVPHSPLFGANDSLDAGNVTWKPGGFTIGKSLQDKLDELVSLPDGRGANDTDDNTILADKQDSGYRRFYAPAGKGTGANGEYRVFTHPWTNPGAGYSDPEQFTENPGNIVDGMQLIGDGIGRTIFDQTDDALANYLFACNTMSDATADNLAGVSFRDLTLYGRSDTLGHSEPQHLVALAGVTSPSFERVQFLAGRGDGICNWMGPKQSGRCHNIGLRVLNCVFDGGDVANGRNAVTIEDMVEWVIGWSRFNNWTSATGGPGGTPHPGFIDVEPQGTNDQFRNRAGRVLFNQFADNPGAAVCFFLSHLSFYATQGGDFQAIGNTANACRIGFDLVGYGPDNGDYPDPTWNHDVLIQGNKVYDSFTPLRARGVRRLTVTDNFFRKSDAGILLAQVPPALTVGADEVGTRITRNWLEELAQSSTDGGPAICSDGPLKNAAIEDNDFVECGRTDDLAGWGFLARTGGDIDLRLKNNRVTNETGRMTVFAAVQTGLDPAITVNANSEKSGNKLLAGADPFAGDNFNPTIGADFTSGITYANGWVAYDADHVSLRKADGLVSLIVSLKSGTTTATTLMLTLPAGCRPAKDLTLIANGNGTFATADLNTAGQLVVKAGVSATFTSFNPVTFLAA
jgi:hypothetical protein